NLACPHTVATETPEPKLIRNVLSENRSRLIAECADDSNDSILDHVRLSNLRESPRVIPRIPNDGIKPNRAFRWVRTVRAIFALYKAATLGAGAIVDGYVDALSGKTRRAGEELLNRHFNRPV